MSGEIDASPEKSFFIEMLTKDVPLLQVVPDLIDNSVDAARQLRPDGDLSGLEVIIIVDPEYFRISDNCGGISIDDAVTRAFRFGRPKDKDPNPGSIGQFGIGMKRAIFKLGTRFKIESNTVSSHFVVDVDVHEWVKHDTWTFDLIDPQQSDHAVRPITDCGTDLVVSNLHPEVSERFALENFQNQLILSVEDDHLESLSNHLSITINGTKLKSRPLNLLLSESVKPGLERLILESPDREPVTIDLWVGVDEPDPARYGWYVFCNGRLILEADKSEHTGWGTGHGGRTNPRAHIQYERFRGYAYFESKDTTLLPWNTTKSGVDIDSPVFAAASLRMRDMMRPVLDLLNRVHRESTSDEKTVTTILSEAKPMPIRSLRPSYEKTTFVWPKEKKATPQKPDVTTISYTRPTLQVNKLKEALDIASSRDLGERTFDYVYRLKIGSE